MRNRERESEQQNKKHYIFALSCNDMHLNAMNTLNFTLHCASPPKKFHFLNLFCNRTFILLWALDAAAIHLSCWSLFLDYSS